MLSLKYHSKAGESESKLWKFFVSLPAQSASGHHLGENEFWLNEDNYARNFLLASLWTINMSDEGEWGGSEKYGYKIRVLGNITIFFKIRVAFIIVKP